MTTVVIIFMIIAAIFALASLGYTGYDIWKEMLEKQAQKQETSAEETEQPQEKMQDETQEQETEDPCEPEAPVAAE